MSFGRATACTVRRFWWPANWKKSYLFGAIDDHSRLIAHAQCYRAFLFLSSIPAPQSPEEADIPVHLLRAKGNPVLSPWRATARWAEVALADLGLPSLTVTWRERESDVQCYLGFGAISSGNEKDA